MSEERLRIVSEFDMPGLREGVGRIAPAAELVVVDGGLPPGLDARVLLTVATGQPQVARTLEALPGLDWVHVYGTGVERFPLAQVPPGATLSCTRGAGATPISEWVLAMLLTFEKDLPASWVKEPPARWFQKPLGGLAGRTLGIAGFGGIGEAIARRALAFDMRVLALTRSPRAQLPAGVEAVDKAGLLARSEHLVLSMPLTAETRGFLDRAALAQLPRGAHVVNIARGGLIDEDALRDALDAGAIACASLDAIAQEPAPAGHWMYAHPRVRLSPHISWSGPGAETLLLQTFLDNLARYLRGEPLQGVVDRVAGY